MFISPAHFVRVALYNGQDAIGLQAVLPVTFIVDDPEISLDALASAFLLTGPTLDPYVRTYLDNVGNDNNIYDLGDFRAYVLRNPDFQAYIGPEAEVEGVVPLQHVGGPTAHENTGGRKLP